MITILTPTYNRKYIIRKAYQSLLQQTDKDFEWLIIDDGSTDETEALIKSFIREKKIKIRYYYKDNGGKHTALNYGINKIKSKYTLILDSDDELLPDCVELVHQKWKAYENDSQIACLSFLKTFPNQEIIGKKYEESEVRSNHIDFRYNRNLLGDMCEVFKTDVLKKYPFPTFPNERFLSEAIVWNRIALDYDTIYINKPIYVADYLEDGLSKSSLKMRYYSPLGAVENANMFLLKRFKLSIRIKNAILYDGFSLIANISVRQIIKESKNKWLTILFLPAGMIFWILLKLKFK